MNLTTDSPDIQTGGARGVFGGGFSHTNVIDYITISTTGNAIDFGDLLNAVQNTGSGCSSSTSGIFSGGFPSTNVIQYITISSTGNAQDFWDISSARNYVG